MDRDLRTLMQRIEALDVYQRTLGADPQPVLQLKAMLQGDWPADLEEYVSNCLPDRSFGRMVRFHSPKELLRENTEYVPGCDAIQQGFLCIAKASDGSQYAYHLPTGQIHLLDTQVYETEERTLECSCEQWAGLAEFLAYYISELETLHAEQSLLERFSDWRTRMMKRI